MNHTCRKPEQPPKTSGDPGGQQVLKQLTGISFLGEGPLDRWEKTGAFWRFCVHGNMELTKKRTPSSLWNIAKARFCSGPTTGHRLSDSTQNSWRHQRRLTPEHQPPFIWVHVVMVRQRTCVLSFHSLQLTQDQLDLLGWRQLSFYFVHMEAAAADQYPTISKGVLLSGVSRDATHSCVYVDLHLFGHELVRPSVHVHPCDSSFLSEPLTLPAYKRLQPGGETGASGTKPSPGDDQDCKEILGQEVVVY